MTVCLQLGWGVLFASNLYYSLVSFRTVFLYFCHDDGFSSRGRLLGSIVTDRLFSDTIMLSPFGSMSRSISSLLLHLSFRFVEICLFPIHSCKLEISIIMWYQNSVPNIFTQLHISTYIFGEVVVTTSFYIFSVVITTAPHWSSLVYYVYFWSGNNHHRLLSPV